MPKQQEFTEEQRRRAVEDYFNKVKTQRQIADELNCATITVAKWVAWAREGRPMASMTSTRGRKSSLSKKHSTWIEKRVDKEPDISMAELARELNKKFKTKYSAGVVLRYVRSYRKRSSQSQDPQIAEIASKPRGTVIRLESDGPRSAYPSDISNKNWRSISATLDAFQRPKAWRASNRELVNGIRFAAITGIDLAYLPHDLPSKQEVRKAYDKWLELGIWQEINVKLGEALELPEAESETVEYEYVID